MKKILTLAAAGLVLASCNFGSGSGVVSTFLSALSAGTDALTDIDGDTLLELPAISDGDVILRHEGYVTCYDPVAKIPVWVAYELTDEETRGEAGREESKFMMDPDYRGTQAMREDYAGSGWTRGHMACAGDFHWDADALDETFYLTNICPQNEELNGGDWNYLEKSVRRWARENGSAWVVSGPIIGEGRYGKIGQRKVTVPDSFFKAVLVNGKGGWRSIAFIMDNDDKRYYLYDCSMSVNELEKLTGLDFFPALPDDVEEAVEGTCRPRDWGIQAR